MAARNVVKAIDWKIIFERTPPNLRAAIGAFKGKSDTIMSSYSKAKTTQTTIDWDHYMQTLDNKV